VSESVRQWTEVWQDDDGSWHWRFVADPGEDGDPVELPANEPESSRAGAEHAARTAYPELPVRVLSEAEAAGAPDPGRHLREALIAAAISAALVLARPRRWTAGTALVTGLAAARQYRRWARR
jgi:hypothetical protein